LNTTSATVTVFHNISTDSWGRHLGMVDGYTAGHALIPVALYTDPAADPSEHAEAAFHTFNVGEDARATVYRKRGNRSLSVGDVVRVQGGTGPHADLWLACARTGWTIVAAPAWIVREGSTPGTAAIPADEAEGITPF
jgi:hypothetical protein